MRMKFQNLKRKPMPRPWPRELSVLACLLNACVVATPERRQDTTAGRPTILHILADDLGCVDAEVDA